MEYHVRAVAILVNGVKKHSNTDGVTGLMSMRAEETNMREKQPKRKTLEEIAADIFEEGVRTMNPSVMKAAENLFDKAKEQNDRKRLDAR